VTTASGTGHDSAAENSLPSAELTELADELRTIWRTLSRGAHLTGSGDQPHRQQFWVLGVLETGPKRMSDLAELARTSQASLTGIVDRLEERGLVERVRNAEDRRVVRVGLTDAGRVEVRCVQAQTAERLQRLLGPLDAEERLELLRLFRKMTAPIEPPTCEPPACEPR
jgi:DNA-binding MarR family transcriptional regulator